MTELNRKEIIEILKNFCERAASLNDGDFIRNLNLQIHVKQEVDGTSVYTGCDGPDRKTVESFLMRFRPFVLQGEGIYFLSVCRKMEFLLRGHRDPILLINLKRAKNAWQSVLDPESPGTIFRIGEEELKQKEIFDLWLNGEFFHPTDKDPEIHRKLEMAKIPPFGDMLFLDFLSLVQKLSQLVLYLDKEVIKRALKK